MLQNFSKYFMIVFLLAMFLFTQSSFAQLTGTKNIPGDYATLADAITALNTQGVGTGGVTLNLVAGNPETAPAGGYVIGGIGSLVLTSTNAADQVIIQGNGNTITASAGLTSGALNDAIFKLIGADYVTITGFTLLENAANTTTTAASNNMTEFGVALFYVTTTDGANNNTISNCTIDLNRTYQNTFGIYVNATHSPTSVSTSATATGLLGGNSGLVIAGNNITDVNLGIVVVGPTAAADHNDGVTIGGSALNANTITNFGTTGTFSSYANVSGTVNGILIRNTKNFTISHNTITSSVGGVTGGTLNGIQQSAFSSVPTGTFTNTISNNTISLQSGVIAGAMNGITCPSGSASTTSTFNIDNNNFVNWGHTVAGTGTITFITNSSTHQNISISNNTFTNITVNTTGSVTFISNGITSPANGTQNINNNSIVTAFSKTGAGGTITLLTTNASSPAGTTVSNSNNNFSNITVTGATTIAGWVNTDGGAPTKTIQNNTFSNWTGGTSSITAMSIGYSTYPSTVTGNTITNITGQGAVTGLIIGSSSAFDVYSNTINNLSSTGTGGTVIGLSVSAGSNNVYSHNIYALSSTGASTVYGISVSGATLNKIYRNNIYNLTNTNAGGFVGGLLVSGGTAVYAYNNFISDLKAPNLNAGISLYGIYASGGTTVGLYYNTIYLNATSVGALFGSAGIYASTTPTLDMRNNIVVNTSTPNGATGFTTAFRRSTSTLTSYSSLSNNNSFYAGTPGVNNLIFFDGTNADQTMSEYKTRVIPRDANSFSENVAFVNSTTAPYDLHINPLVQTQLESGGAPVSTPVAITDDFEGELRNLTTPDIGADEFTGTGLDLTSPNMTYTLLANTSYTNNRQLTVTITDPSGVATSPNGPVLYYKKSTDVTFVADNAPTVQGDNYTFTINNANLSGVAAGDIIQYYVAAMDLNNNSGTSPAGGSGTPPGTTPPATFNSYTIITASALPYTQDFNAGTTLPAGWSSTMSVTANHGTAGSNGLTKNLYSSTPTANANTPIVGLIEATTQLEFDYRIVNFSSYPGTATIIGASDVYNIRISTDDGATFTTVYTINQANHVVSTNFATVTVPLGAYAGYNGVIRWELQWGAGDYYFDIDNVIIRVPPVGPPNPAVLVSPANGGNTISINTTLNWSSGGGAVETGYRIYFGTDGGGVTPPTDIANNVDLGLVTSYTPASPLAYATTYYWQIVPYNGSGNATGNLIWSFTTGPNPNISTFPYTQDFEGTLFPPYGFTNYGTKSWTKTLTGGVGSSAAARVSYTPAGTANLQTPNVILPVSPTYRAKFWWKDNDIAAKQGDGPEIIGHDTTYFEISTDGGSNWTILSFLAAASSQSSYVESVNDLTPYAGQTVIFRWRDISNGSSSAYGTGLDNILIEEIPAGPIFSVAPTSKNFGSIISGNTSAPQIFTISNTGAADLIINSGDITVTGANADQFILGSITYPITINPGGNAVISAAFSPTSVGIKTANLQIVHNAPGSPSTVALSGNGLPLGVLFEDFTNADALARWKTVNLDGGISNWYRSTSKFNSSPASAGCDYEPDARQNNDWLISPKLAVATGDSLTFYHSIQSTSYPETFVVKVGTTTNDPTTGTWVDLATINDNTTTWKYKMYDLSAYAGQNIYIAFVYRSEDAFTVYVDDITGPVVYVPAVDLAFTDFYQSTGLPVPKTGENFVDYRISTNPKSLTDSKPFAALLNSSNAVMSSDVNNTVLKNGNNTDALMLNNVSIKAFVKNFGLNAASYDLGWNVNGVSQTPFSGPSVLSGETDSTVLTYTPAARGTFITSGDITVTADENPDNNVNDFRMRVYPDVFTRTSYDRGDNTVDTWVGWGATGTTPFKAGVRYTATSDVKLAGVDFIYNTEALTPGEITVQVRAAGTTTEAPAAVLYTAIFNTAAYFPGGGDFIHLPFGDDAPTIASGSDYWVTVKVPLGAYYPGGVHNTGFTAGRSYFESNTDTTLWNPLVITTERAWIMRSVEVIPATSTFQLSVNVMDGWNMTSIPGLHPVDQNVNTWWPNRNPLADVYKWNGSYTTVPLANPTEGYWMLHTGAQTYNTGDEWPAGGIQLVAHDPIAVTAGWNMIGGYENSPLVSGLTTTPPGIITPGTIYGWNGTYFNATTLEPGYGYWVLLTGAGVINTPTLAKETPLTKEDDRSEWGKITVSDASGKSYVLYSVNGEVNLDNYLMPPLPPTGSFDVRYSSNRKAENLKEGNQAIEMRGLIYPVTVKVENGNIKLQDETGKLVNAKLESGNEIIINNSQVSKLFVSENIVPDVYSLEQNYPNPFNPSTVIEFSIPEDAVDVKLTIYNALGQKVTELVNTKLEAGKYQYKWDASEVASGLYIYELRTSKFSSVKKMMLLK